MRVYLSGRISDGGTLDAAAVEGNKLLFWQAEQTCKDIGVDVCNPLRTPESGSWQEYMRAGIIGLMSCDAILMLKNWVYSRGARIELDIAFSLGIPTYFSLSELHDSITKRY